MEDAKFSSKNTFNVFTKVVNWQPLPKHLKTIKFELQDLSSIIFLQPQQHMSILVPEDCKSSNDFVMTSMFQDLKHENW